MRIVITTEKLKAELQELRNNRQKLIDSKDRKDFSKEEHRELLDLRFNIRWCEESLQAKMEQASRIRRDSHLGDRFQTRVFDTFDLTYGDKEAFARCEKYADDVINHRNMEHNSLVLIGGNGVGKTHLAAAIANKVIDEGEVTSFVTFADILHEERERISNPAKPSRLEYYSSIQLLVIDDLGKEKQSEWSKEVLFTIINKRYERMLPTVITTNMSIESMMEKLDNAVFSRLYEMCDIIQVNGRDKRKS